MDTPFREDAAPETSPGAAPLAPLSRPGSSTSPTKRPGMSALDLTGAKISQHLSEGAAQQAS
jgi:hypothetical protein